MRALRKLQMRLRSLFRRAEIERELDDELRFHLEHQVEQNIARGMDAAEARSAAVREFGGVSQRKDECRDARRTRLIESLWQDSCYAVRNFRRDPFLALTATLTLAVCIGAITTVFGVANSILIRPLPYPNSGRIDWVSDQTGPAQQDIGAAPDYFYIREQNRMFEDVAAFRGGTVNWTGVERPEQLDIAGVSPSFFGVMGTRPMLGRYFTPEEEGTKAPPVVVLSYAFWKTKLGSDSSVVGKALALDRLPHTIVGVMPQGFDYPRGSQMWLPLEIDSTTQRFPLAPTRPIAIVSMLARRKAGITAVEAATEMNRLTFALRAAYPQAFRKNGFRNDLTVRATPLREHLAGQLRPAVLALSGAVLLVLLIACANIANLLLARAGSRHRELAVRLALGSGRGRIMRQMLTESLVLAIPGGVAGIALAWLAVYALNATKPDILVRYPAIAIDGYVLAFTLALLFATSLLFGVAPALSAAGIRIHDALKFAEFTHSAGRGAVRVRRLLVVAEIGMSLVLLIGAGLVTRSFVHLAHTELGFQAEDLVTFRMTSIDTSDRHYGQLYSDVLDRLRHLPMVREAALASDIPASDDDFGQILRMRVIGRPLVPIAQRPLIHDTIVSPEFFRTLGIPLKSGRIADQQDSFRPPEPVVVNEAFVRQIFPGEDPLGRRIGFGPDERNATWTIVGVVGDVRAAALGADPPSMVYRCTCAGIPIYRAAFFLRTAVSIPAVVRATEEQVHAVDRDQPIYDVKTMDQRRDAAVAPERFQLILLGSFAFIAIVLAAAGVYGTMSYLVTRRTREIGIRMAMGARPADVLRMVLNETGALAVLAVAAGLAGAWALTRYLRSMLYGVSALDATTFAVTSVFLVLIVLIAALGPARRAVRVDPMTALRDE